MSITGGGGGGKWNSDLFGENGIIVSYSVLIVSLPIYYVIIIRGVGISLETFLVYGLISIITAASLSISLRNSARTKLQQLYLREAVKLRRSSISSKKCRPNEEGNFQSALESASIFYSLTLNSTIFLIVFSIFAAGLFSALPTFFNFTISTIIPSVALLFLTSPKF